jgi:hypothetical protein
MSESVHEQIAAAIQTALAGIVADNGTTYWYRPNAVRRVVWFDEQYLDSSLAVIYLLRPGIERVSEEASQQIAGSAEFFLVVARRHEKVSEDPARETAPTRWTVADRMVRDVLKKLLADPTLGGKCDNVFAEDVTIDRDMYLDTWALAELRFIAQYTTAGSAP